MSAGEPIQRFQFNDEDIEVEEADESEHTNGRLYDQFYEMAEKFAGTYVGQYVTGKIDGFLKLIEDTAKWSLPPKNTNNSTAPLERPLPWIPFIALILMLRLVRIGLSIGGLLIGNAPLVPSDVVYFIQTRRRKLRAIRISGMKEIVKTEQFQENKQEGGLLSKMRSIMSMAICRPKLVEDTQNIFVGENYAAESGSSTINKTQQNHNTSRNYCLDEDADLSINQMLDKYAENSNDDDDSDFVPPNDALNDSDSSSTSTSTSSSSFEEDKNDDQEEEIESTRNDPMGPTSNNNPESESSIHVTNGNISIESQEMEAKDNGELTTKLRKPKIMPKPLKDEPLPLPIQEIKQEPTDSDEDTNRNRIEFGNSEVPYKSSDLNPQPHQKSIVAFENNYKDSTRKSGSSENGFSNKIEKTNGDQHLTQTGSPDLCGAYGFQPTSILKNCQAVDLEQRGIPGGGDFARNEDFIKGESTIESETTSRITKSSNHPGKPIKNKFKGKRR